jgi:hypothetical protein
MADSIDEDLETPEAAEDWVDDDIELDPDALDVDDIDDIDGDDDDDVISSADDDDDDDVDDDEEEGEPLDELEAEELEMLTEDEAAESLPVDEAEELREIRRATMSLESSADSAGDGEFVCTNCYLVKSGAQLVDKRKKLCRDCA